jgi:hypothetical protein
VPTPTSLFTLMPPTASPTHCRVTANHSPDSSRITLHAELRVPRGLGRASSERPVPSRDQLLALGRHVLRASTLNIVDVHVRHTAQFTTRLAGGQVLSSDDGDLVHVSIVTTTAPGVPPSIAWHTNQVREEFLVAGLQLCETLQREFPTFLIDRGTQHDSPAQDTPVPVRLWHDATVGAMQEVRQTAVPAILNDVRNAGFSAAGFVGLMARSEATVHKDGNLVFAHEETDCEVNIVAYDTAAHSVGWGGACARDWTKLDWRSATAYAIEMATRGRDPVAVEPGRRTAIFTPSALAPMLAFFSLEFEGGATKRGETALSKSSRGGAKWGQRVLDRRLRVYSDPGDPEGGYRPYNAFHAFATPPMTWIDNGVLTNLAFGVVEAMTLGKAYAEQPISFHVTGGDTTVAQMIASCEEGILVNRTTSVDLIDKPSGLLTGVTNGGCFLIKEGKISKPVKNFRFLDSPFFFLNRLEAMGKPERATFGHIPDAQHETWSEGWPRPPIVVPPMMVRDFNFNGLAEAV